MKARWLTSVALVCTAAGLFAVSAGVAEESSVKTKRRREIDEKYRLSLDVARDRAQVMHDVYSATLETMHHRYFHSPRAVVPARAMQDVFSTIERQSKIKARWISVNTKPMSIDHAPESKFEKQAAREIAAGKEQVEAVEDGYYRRAGAIPLTGGCISCHAGFFKAGDEKPRFAGLVISVPVRKGAILPPPDAPSEKSPSE